MIRLIFPALGIDISHRSLPIEWKFVPMVRLRITSTLYFSHFFNDLVLFLVGT